MFRSKIGLSLVTQEKSISERVVFKVKFRVHLVAVRIHHGLMRLSLWDSTLLHVG